MSDASASRAAGCALSPLDRLRFCFYRYPYCRAVVKELAGQMGFELDPDNLENSFEELVEREARSLDGEPRGYREAAARARAEAKIRTLLQVLTSLLGDDLCPTIG